MQRLLGAHMSVAGGLDKAFSRGEALGCTAMQVFTKNANQWRGKELDEETVETFRRARLRSPIQTILAHDSYLINLGAPADNLWRQSIAAFVDEVQRCARLGIPFLVMHPGSHVGTGIEKGLARVAEALRLIAAETPPEVTILLENTAGQGSSLGARFEELATLLEQLPAGRFGICFDTCHAFAAGYDLGSAEGVSGVLDDFNRRLGLPLLRAFHLNDSKKGVGCRVDRHEHIGQGSIGREGFRALLQDPRFYQIPMILETPKGAGDVCDRMNLALLRQLAEEV